MTDLVTACQIEGKEVLLLRTPHIHATIRQCLMLMSCLVHIRPLLSVPHILAEGTSAYYHSCVLALMTVYKSGTTLSRSMGLWWTMSRSARFVLDYAHYIVCNNKS